MSTTTNVFGTYASATGTLYAGPTNVCGYHIKPGGTAGSVVLRDGGAGGTTKITLDVTTDTSVITMLIPGNGVRFDSNVHATLPAGTSITAFCG